MWSNIDTDEAVHIVPVDDLVAHEYVDCACGPTVELTPGSAPCVIHHALDGRD